MTGQLYRVVSSVGRVLPTTQHLETRAALFCGSPAKCAGFLILYLNNFRHVIWNLCQSGWSWSEWNNICCVNVSITSSEPGIFHLVFYSSDNFVFFVVLLSRGISRGGYPSIIWPFGCAVRLGPIFVHILSRMIFIMPKKFSLVKLKLDACLCVIANLFRRAFSSEYFIELVFWGPSKCRCVIKLWAAVLFLAGTCVDCPVLWCPVSVYPCQSFNCRGNLLTFFCKICYSYL